MFVIPLNFPATIFLLGAVFHECVSFTPYLSWLTWCLGVFLTILRWRTIRKAITVIWNFYLGYNEVFTLADINLIRVITKTKSSWNIIGTWEAAEISQESKMHEAACRTQLLNFGEENIINDKKNVLLIGCGCGEEGLYIQEKFGCSVTCLDKDFEKVQHGNDRISRSRLWNKAQVKFVEAFEDLFVADDRQFDVSCSLAPVLWWRKSRLFDTLWELSRVGKPEAAVCLQGLLFSRQPQTTLALVLQSCIPHRLRSKFLVLEDLTNYDISREMSVGEKRLLVHDHSQDFLLYISTIIEQSREAQPYLCYWTSTIFICKLILLEAFVKKGWMKFVWISYISTSTEPTDVDSSFVVLN